MLTVIRRYAIDPAGMPRLKELAGQAASTVGGVAGCKGYFLVGSGDSTVVSITICDDEVAAQRSNEVAAKWVGANLPGVAKGPPEVIAGTLLARS
jgi:hypothetical protein